MKHAMAVRALLAAACALGGAAMAQPDAATNMPTSGSEAAAPGGKMTRTEKKQSLEKIRKAVHDAESKGQLSGKEGTEATKGMSSKAEHVRVLRRGDKVVLKGNVSSREEKDKLGSAATDAGTGENIVNELIVK
jgi:hypothetical protein